MCVHVYFLNLYASYFHLVDVTTGERHAGRPRAASFSEQQAKYAKTAIEESLDSGDKLFECTQGVCRTAHIHMTTETDLAPAQVILSWYYYSQARCVYCTASRTKYSIRFNVNRWVDACLSMAMATRLTVPCALNVCPPFHGITASQPFTSKPPTILPSAKTVIEDEVRRNTFWLGK